MTPRRLAQLTRQLIDACGGEQEAPEHGILSVSRIKKVCSANQPEELRLSEIAALEEYCGQPIISGELCGRFDRPRGGDLMTAALQLNTDAAKLAQIAHEIQSEDSPGGKVITQYERDQAHAALDASKKSISACEAALDGSPNLRVVAAE